MTMAMPRDAGCATILVVDDMPANLGVVAEALESCGYRVVVAQDGQEALDRAVLVQPDLILLDVMMPGINGFETCHRLKAIAATRNIPVLFMTALTDTSDILVGFEAGGADYVTKPAQIEELLARVRVHLSLRAIEQRLSEQNIRLRQEIADRKQAEAALARARDELEERVQQRTAELMAAKEQQIQHQARQLAAEADRALLLQRLVGVQEEERLRIARELHDQTGQDLTALSLGLKSLEGAIGGGAARDTLGSLLALTTQIGRNLHRVAWELRPTSLDDVGLVRALETYLGDWGERFGIAMDFHASAHGAPLTMPREIETTAFRLIQEALTNIAKHAQARAASIVLERDDDQLQIIVEDNGRGFNPDEVVSDRHLGLAGMRERLALVRGTMTIDSTAGAGTTLYFRIPCTVATAI